MDHSCIAMYRCSTTHVLGRLLFCLRCNRLKRILRPTPTRQGSCNRHTCHRTATADGDIRARWRHARHRQATAGFVQSTYAPPQIHRCRDHTWRAAPTVSHKYRHLWGSCTRPSEDISRGAKPCTHAACPGTRHPVQDQEWRAVANCHGRPAPLPSTVSTRGLGSTGTGFGRRLILRRRSRGVSREAGRTRRLHRLPRAVAGSVPPAGGRCLRANTLVTYFLGRWPATS